MSAARAWHGEPDPPLRRLRRRRPRLLRGRSGRDLRLPRPERRGQDHDDQDAHRASLRPTLGPRDGSRASTSGRETEAIKRASATCRSSFRSTATSPSRRTSPSSPGSTVSPRARRGAARLGARDGGTRRSAADGSRRSCRSAGSSAWRSAARCCTSRRSSSSTSRPRASIPSRAASFWDLIYALAADGTTVFVTTHYMEEAEYCHRLALMNRGRLIALDTPGRAAGRDGGAAARGQDRRRARARSRRCRARRRCSRPACSAAPCTSPSRDAERRVAAAAGRGSPRENVDVAGDRAIAPALEDVFVALVREAGGAVVD